MPMISMRVPTKSPQQPKKHCFKILFKLILSILSYLYENSYKDCHHDQSIDNAQQLCRQDLIVCFGCQADYYKQDQGNKVDYERGRVVQAEGRAETSSQHDKNAPRTENGANHHHDLVEDIEDADVVIVPDHSFVIGEQIQDVCQGRGHPPPSLIVEFLESFRTSGERI